MSESPHVATFFVHYRENLRKCSLQPLRGRPEFRFARSAPQRPFDASGHTLLALDGPTLSPADRDRPLLILDATWRLLPQLRRLLTGDYVVRSLPTALRTAYPRTGQFEPDPDEGLASVEALFAALVLVDRRDDSVLDDYRERDAFLAKCREAGVLPRSA